MTFCPPQGAGRRATLYGFVEVRLVFGGEVAVVFGGGLVVLCDVFGCDVLVVPVPWAPDPPEDCTGAPTAAIRQPLDVLTSSSGRSDAV